MKIRNVYDRIFSMENLYLAYENAIKGRRYNRDVLKFNANLWENLKSLQDRYVWRMKIMDNFTGAVIIVLFVCGVCIGIIGTVLTTVVSKNDKEEDNDKI